MSGLYLLLVLGIWAGLTALIVKGWRRLLVRDDAPKRRTHAVFVPLLACWLGVTFWYGGGRKVYYDAEVNRMCREDGGVKVYETVRLPAERFDKYGQVNFYNPTQGENALGADYLLKTDVQFIQSGNPSLRRYHVQVIRYRDGFLLGESIGYDRGGGDFPGPWQPSSFSCPKHHGEAVIDKVFVLDQGVQK